MKNELIISGDTVELAVENGLEQLNLTREEVDIEIIEKEQKGLFGKVKTPAKIKINYSDAASKGIKAKVYIENVLKAMDIGKFEIKMEEDDNIAIINLEGENIDAIIGKQGESLDAIQYLSSLVANAGGGDYCKITLDSGNFRTKREQALVKLANSVASIVKRTGNSSTLEPMNPFERRIIHATISEINGVSSKSIGEEPNRQIIIVSDRPSRTGRSNYTSPAPRKYEKPTYTKKDSDIYSFEKSFKKSESKEEKLAKLYSKIEVEE